MDQPLLSWPVVGGLLGGVGLLLLGMEQMTDGLRVAAGRSLHALLSNWTRTRTRGFLSGVLLTAVVQSSSAVTVATIGFANAGLLTLAQAAWVVFGCNLGTTMTGWLVAAVGLKVEVEALALPIVGVGMALAVARPRWRLGALGRALAGFGALFLGLAFLKDTFAGLGDALDLSRLEDAGLAGLVGGVGLGALLTVLMQSSSAALAVVLTAASEGVVSIPLGGAMVIGANVGTTSTALLSTFGATSNAKRVALVHVAFNLLTGAVATLVLLPFLAGLRWLVAELGFAPDAATRLAAFHTAFNLLGVVLMWPCSGPTVRFLERRFVRAEEEEGRPRHVDPTVLDVPEVAMSALVLELQRAGTLVLRTARLSLAYRTVLEDRLEASRAGAQNLLAAIGDFVTELGRRELPDTLSEALVRLLRVHQHYLTVLRLTEDVTELRAELEGAGGRRVALRSRYVGAVRAMLAAADTSDAAFDPAALRARYTEQERRRAAEKRHVLERGIAGERSSTATSLLVQELAQVRRMAYQVERAARALHSLRVLLGQVDSDEPPEPPHGAEFVSLEPPARTADETALGTETPDEQRAADPDDVDPRDAG